MLGSEPAIDRIRKDAIQKRLELPRIGDRIQVERSDNLLRRCSMALCREATGVRQGDGKRSDDRCDEEHEEKRSSDTLGVADCGGNVRYAHGP
jgi:hypothetical protein